MLFMSWAQARNPGGRASRRPSQFLDALRPRSEGGSVAPGKGGSKKQRGPARCRVCQAPLGSVPERRLGRHEGCPSPYDEALFERLRAWRLERAQADGVPAYVVFTDLTLQALAEVRPADTKALLRVNGIGAAKLDRYGEEVLALLAKPQDPAR
jgi:DNA helicase-2/ATP-dependent DNA helicase PcrA